jgi:hypothetical protein
MMSTSITEEASKLRATAASLIIQNQLETIEINRQITNFKIESTTAEGLSDNEFRNLVVIWDNVGKLLQQLKTVISTTSSAISASVIPANSAAQITSVIDELTNSTSFLTDAQLGLSEFNHTDVFTIRKNILQNAHDKINRAAEGIRNAIRQLHLLLFG